MAYKRQGLEILGQFLPEQAVAPIIDIIRTKKILLTITKERATKLGDYTWDRQLRRHKISVNGNLNPYEFLVTLLHEIAHAVTYEMHSHKVAPHGQEWKSVYQKILLEFYHLEGVFPLDIKQAIMRHIHNIKYTHCSDEVLSKTLRAYNVHILPTVSDLNIGATFKTKKGDSFRIIEKKRTRYKCECIDNGKMYLFPGNYEIM